MTDFKVEILALLEATLPELGDRIQAGAVDERTATPFAAYTTPEEIPIRTKSGIAGYQTTFEVSLYDKGIAKLELLRHRVIAAMERAELGEKVCTYRSSTTEYYPDYDLHGATMIFRIV